jgi:hypothetical protein
MERMWKEAPPKHLYGRTNNTTRNLLALMASGPRFEARLPTLEISMSYASRLRRVMHCFTFLKEHLNAQEQV